MIDEELFNRRMDFIQDQTSKERDLRKLCTYCEKPLWGVLYEKHDKCIEQFHASIRKIKNLESFNRE